MRDAFVNTGIWPMDYGFCNLFEVIKGGEVKRQSRLAGMRIYGPASAVRTLRRRRCDRETFEEIKGILSNSRDPSTAICEVDKVLRDHDTVSSILQEIRPVPFATPAAGTRKKLLGCGAPSQCLTRGINRTAQGCVRGCRGWAREEIDSAQRDFEDS